MRTKLALGAVTIAATLIGSAQAQMRSQPKLPDPRGEFVRQCAPHMVGRWAHPESVCGCLHDHAAATVEDSDLREVVENAGRRYRRWSRLAWPGQKEPA